MTPRRITPKAGQGAIANKFQYQSNVILGVIDTTY